MVLVLLVHVDVIYDFTMFDCLNIVRRYDDVVDPIEPAVAFVSVCWSIGFAYRVYRREVVVLQVCVEMSSSAVLSLLLAVVANAAGCLVAGSSVGVDHDMVNVVCLGIMVEVLPPRRACFV